jgi:hypothetical protein
MRQFVLFSIVCFMFLSAKAEIGISAGARAGFNVTHLRKYNAPEFFKKRVALGSDIAAVIRIDFNKNFSLQTEVEFTQKGQAWKRTQDSAKYVSRFTANYIQFPILAVARVGSEKYKAVFYLGPYLAYWAGGYTQNSVSVDKQSRQSNTDKYLFSKNDMRLDVGLTTGIGGDFKAGKGWIQLMARHNLGLLSTAKKNSGLPKLYNCNFNFSVGYLYTIK